MNSWVYPSCSMYCLVIIYTYIVLTLESIAIESALTDIEFKIHKWNKCLPMESGFRIFVKVSLKECAYECSLRPLCNGLGYHRMYKLCELYSANIGEVLENLVDDNCVFIARENITTASDMQAVTCPSEAQVLDGQSGTCAYKECMPFPLDHGTIYGNLNTIGSRKKYKCNLGYIETNGKTTSMCQDTGTWDYLPICVEFARLGELCKVTNENGAWENYVCEDPLAICHANEHVCVCVEGFDDNGPNIDGGTCISCPNVNPSWIHPSDQPTFNIQIDNQATVTWNEANQKCSEMGGHLVKVDSTLKLNFIHTILRNCPAYTGMDFWTDGIQTNDNSWVFSDGTPLSMEQGVFWCTGTPNSGDSCTRFRAGCDWLWDDRDCFLPYNFICEMGNVS